LLCGAGIVVVREHRAIAPPPLFLESDEVEELRNKSDVNVEKEYFLA